MRALHVANGRLFGGIERTLVTLGRSAPSQAAVEHVFTVCARGRLLDELRSSGCRVDLLGDVRLSRPASVWIARARLRRTLGEWAPDVVICHAPWAYALFAPVAARLRLPVIWWQHDRATGQPFIERWASTTPAALVISNSRWTAGSAEIVQRYAPSLVIPCPVDVPARSCASDCNALRRSLSTDPADVVVITASRMEPWKGHLNLLTALGRLASISGWRLWIAGGARRAHERAYRAELERAVAGLGLQGRTQFLGERDDVPRLLGGADLFCQPNTQPEPFGVVLAEALLSGIPVVTTAAGGAPEIVDSSCGRLVAPGDLDGLTHALRELITDRDLRARLGAAGPGHARSRCAPDVVLPQLDRTLAACCSQAAA